jgi:hypothetical protein
MMDKIFTFGKYKFSIMASDFEFRLDLKVK